MGESGYLHLAGLDLEEFLLELFDNLKVVLLLLPALGDRLIESVNFGLAPLQLALGHLKVHL